MTGSIGKPETGSKAVDAADVTKNEALPPPFRLPTATRARMRECGENWQAKKMAGTAGSDTWREYAMACLVTDNDRKPQPAR